MTADKPRLPVGMVWLVGAGPGDPGLITVAGLERLREADVIVYDRLVSPRLLESAPESAELIYMGKGAGEGRHDQSAINDRLIEKARLGKRVVRLKGGDPFVFGRGGEEAEALRAAGLTLIAASNGNLDLDVPGLARYFDATLFAEDADFLKPDPRFFAQAVERGGGTPATAAAVGDRLDNDYEPARAAGLHTVLIDRDGEVSDPAVLRIGALTELPGLLAPLRA